VTCLLLLPGDGIGPEITAATRRVLETVDARYGLGLVIETLPVGFDSLATSGSTLPDAVLVRAREVDGIVLGPLSTADYPPPSQGGVNPSAAVRTGLDLYANIRPSRTFSGVPAVAADMDLVLVRENTEGFYADRTMYAGSGEFMPTPTSPSRCARSAARARRGSRAPPAGSRWTAAGGLRSCTRPTC